jgi:hypothetical protein
MQSAQATSAASDLVLQAPPQQTADAPSTHQTTANELQSELPAAPQQPCAEPGGLSFSILLQNQIMSDHTILPTYLITSICDSFTVRNLSQTMEMSTQIL